MSSDSKKPKSESESKKKAKENKKHTKLSVTGHKKGESGVVAKSLTMTKISTPEKCDLVNQKKSATKRKISKDQSVDIKAVSRKPGRPRSISTASDAGKGKFKAANGTKNILTQDFPITNGNTELNRGTFQDN